MHALAHKCKPVFCVVENGRFVALEPDPSYPTGTALCAKERAASLGYIETGATYQATITAIAYGEVAAVERIDPDGSVVAKDPAVAN
jgi:hypothetical protein